MRINPEHKTCHKTVSLYVIRVKYECTWENVIYREFFYNVKKIFFFYNMLYRNEKIIKLKEWWFYIECKSICTSISYTIFVDNEFVYKIYKIY